MMDWFRSPIMPSTIKNRLFLYGDWQSFDGWLTDGVYKWIKVVTITSTRRKAQLNGYIARAETSYHESELKKRSWPLHWTKWPPPGEAVVVVRNKNSNNQQRHTFPVACFLWPWVWPSLPSPWSGGAQLRRMSWLPVSSRGRQTPFSTIKYSLSCFKGSYVWKLFLRFPAFAICTYVLDGKEGIKVEEAQNNFVDQAGWGRCFGINSCRKG